MTYISSDQSVVYLEDIHSWHIITTDHLKKGKNEAIIIVHDDTGIQDEATVYLTSTGVDNITGKGENDDESSGERSKKDPNY